MLSLVALQEFQPSVAMVACGASAMYFLCQPLLHSSTTRPAPGNFITTSEKCELLG